ncbi:hypothetical protein [Streptomyces beigongshangae]|uniref:hypothetical protein n=1 Tax=Streptomyces beigongshangae TaxID=2841597 RepID=UPI001C852655|nr:hypothetical protein [Streptomyces sp. REN17]
MADDDEFYRSDRPDHPKLPEDRPRGGGPEDSGQSRKPTWMILGAVVVLIVLLALFMI